MKKYITILIILSLIVIAAAYIIVRFYQDSHCLDCEEAGWQKTNMNCQAKIVTKEDAQLCLFQNNIASRQSLINPNITQGYIRIGESDIYNTPKSGGI